nr:PREDICTED: T-cell surface protein tactile isoform X3 [Anolis carolinensis]|eukprot:XP_016848038.1 PREDICTED: T-cell surface protein tactile isoform X3 [Anolis carolinensis]
MLILLINLHLKMEMRWLVWAYYFILNHFILMHLISGQSEIIIKKEEYVYALPGDDVTLTCSILKGKGVHVTQTQWSKVDAASQRNIGVYNPRYGTVYTDRGYNYSINFRKSFQYCQTDFSHSLSSTNHMECDQWILQMRNVSLEQSGLYECSFATYPAGTTSSEINLVVMKSDDKNFVVETLLNQTLEIPCLKDMPSENLTNASLNWFLQKENKNEELLISKQSYYGHEYITRPTSFKERIKMNQENTLIISPVSVFDDGTKFICSVVYQPGRMIRSTTVMKVFVKPEISITLNENFRGKANFTCMVRKAFPKPKLLWYIGGEILKDKSEGIFMENEEPKVAGGFFEMRSLLTIWSTTQLPINQSFKCISVYRFPGNQTQNVSSEEVLSYGLQKTVKSIKPSRQVTPVLESSTIRTLSTGRVAEKSTLTIPDHSFTAKNWLNSTGNLSTERVVEQTTVSSSDNSPTLKGRFNTNGTTTSPKHTNFSWPAVVAALLSFCTFFIILGIRKWCQYQKEIMNRPPSFKPPPPPIKYTSMPRQKRHN